MQKTVHISHDLTRLKINSLEFRDFLKIKWSIVFTKQRIIIIFRPAITSIITKEYCIWLNNRLENVIFKFPTELVDYSSCVIMCHHAVENF